MDYTGIVGARGSGKTTLLTVIAGLVHLNAFNPKGKQRLGIALSSHHKVDFEVVWPLVLKMYPEAQLEAAPDVYYMPNNLRKIDLDQMHYKVIFWDDLQNLFDLRFRDQVPPEIRMFLASVRHYHSQIFYTCPSWSRCDKDLRLGTGRLLRTSRSGRLLFAAESRVFPDENDATGSTIIVRPVHFFPHWIWLPFDPEDQMYKLEWGKMRSVAKYVGVMFDSWAHVVIGEHVAEGREEKINLAHETTRTPRRRNRNAGGRLRADPSPSKSEAVKVAAAAGGVDLQLQAADVPAGKKRRVK